MQSTRGYGDEMNRRSKQAKKEEEEREEDKGDTLIVWAGRIAFIRVTDRLERAACISRSTILSLYHQKVLEGNIYVRKRIVDIRGDTSGAITTDEDRLFLL